MISYSLPPKYEILYLSAETTFRFWFYFLTIWALLCLFVFCFFIDRAPIRWNPARIQLINVENVWDLSVYIKYFSLWIFPSHIDHMGSESYTYLRVCLLWINGHFDLLAWGTTIFVHLQTHLFSICILLDSIPEQLVVPHHSTFIKIAQIRSFCLLM